MPTRDALDAIRIILIEALFFGLLATCIVPVRKEFQRRALLPLLVIAGLAVASFFNFGGLQNGQSIHVHDTFHYFMGVKYFRNLGYFNLYRATVLAARELGREPATVAQIRDLRSQRLEHVDPASYVDVKEGFTDDRWWEFKQDLLVFIEKSPDWRIVLSDFGNVSPPTRTAFLAPFLNAFELTHARLCVLCQLDVAALALSFIAVGYAFGLRVGLLCLAFFGLNYFNGYSWIGGSVLRYDWFCAVLLSIAALKLDRPRLSGALMTYAAFIRIFPVCFIVVIGAKLVASRAAGKKDAVSTAFLQGVILAATVLTIVTAASFPTWTIYQEYVGRLQTFATKPSTSRISYLELDRFFFHPIPPGIESAPGSWVAKVLGVLFFLGSLRALARSSPLECLQFGCAPIFFFGHITSYYYSFPAIFFILPFARRRLHVFDVGKMLVLLAISMAGYLMNEARFSMLRTHSWLCASYLTFYVINLLLDNVEDHAQFAGWLVRMEDDSGMEPPVTSGELSRSSPEADPDSLARSRT